MNTGSKRALAVIGGSATVAVASLVIALSQTGSAEGNMAGEDMSTGVTVTANPSEGAGPAEGTLPIAAPRITGPAPLPTEEQGLPG